MTSGNNFNAARFFGSPILSRVVRLVLVAFCAVYTLSGPHSAIGQTTTSSQEQNGGQEGVERAGYQIHQSIEFGYRVTDTVGSDSMYETLVDLHTGPRLLEQTLSMKSDNQQGILFDDLYISSFGWGGDPENVLRARASKYQW
jgi:hypothetical protein